MEKYVKASVAAEYYCFSRSQIRKMAREGKIPVKKTLGGQYLYLIHENFIVNAEKKNYIYCRVSSKKQIEELEKQVLFLQEKYPEYEVVKDIGSGMDFDRIGFKMIIENLLNRNVNNVVVAHKDRFSRFGFEFFEWLFDKMNAKLISDDNTDNKDDVLGDIMEILTVFTARYYGKRKYKKRLKKIFN